MLCLFAASASGYVNAAVSQPLASTDPPAAPRPETTDDLAARLRRHHRRCRHGTVLTGPAAVALGVHERRVHRCDSVLAACSLAGGGRFDTQEGEQV